MDNHNQRHLEYVSMTGGSSKKTKENQNLKKDSNDMKVKIKDSNIYMFPSFYMSHITPTDKCHFYGNGTDEILRNSEPLVIDDSIFDEMYKSVLKNGDMKEGQGKKKERKRAVIVQSGTKSDTNKGSNSNKSNKRRPRKPFTITKGSRKRK